MKLSEFSELGEDYISKLSELSKDYIAEMRVQLGLATVLGMYNFGSSHTI